MKPCLLQTSALVVLLTTSLTTSARAQSAPAQPAVALRHHAGVTDTVVPGDFNNDGIQDLAVRDAATRHVGIALGRGDGTFAPARTIFLPAAPLAVGDFNGDGKLDVVSFGHSTIDGRTWVYVLKGNGDGTLGAGRGWTSSFVDPQFAIPADFNGDHKLDLAVGGDTDRVEIIPGNGDDDLLFGPAVVLTAGQFPTGGDAGDIDGDGDIDLVVSNAGDNLVVRFENQGGLMFQRTYWAPFDRPVRDVDLADVNGDSLLDMVVLRTASDGPGDEFGPGVVDVFLNQGRGMLTFPTSYGVAKGGLRLAIDDFNHDGRIDVATANHSFFHQDGCANEQLGFASVTILPGRGNGTFAPGSTFALADQRFPDANFRGAVWSMYAADVDRDTHADLVISFGDILLTRPPDPNWPPSVSAGPDQRLRYESFVQLHASASDVDQDWLQYSWTRADGTLVSVTPNPCFPSSLPAGTHTFTVRVDDGHGHTASDSVTVTINPPTVAVTSPAAGEVVNAGTPYTIRWTTDADGIWTWRVLASTNGGATWSAIAECAEVDGSLRQCTWQSPGPVSENALVSVQAIVDRRVEGSGTSGVFHIRGTTATPRITVTAPREGDVLEVDATTLITWTADAIPGLASWAVEWIDSHEGGFVSVFVCAGLPVSARSCSWEQPRFPLGNVHIVVHARDASGRDIATGESGAFRVEGWSAASVGAVTNASVSEAPNRGFVVRTMGGDIWGTADAFTWAYRRMDGDFHGMVTLANVEGTHAWTKVGVMIRQSLDPGSPHHFVLASLGKGLAYQRRLTQGGTSLNTSLGTSALPVMVQVGRQGRQIFMNLNRGGATWERVVIADFIDGPVLVGVAASSHDPGVFGTGIFEEVELTRAPVVTVVAPAGGEVVQAGQPYTVRWTASAPHAIETATASFSADDGASWTPVCGSEGGNSCVWNNPLITEQGRIQVVVETSRNDIGRGISGRFSVRGAAGGLPAGWSNRDIGAVGAAGSASYSNGTFTVSGSGADIWGTADEFHFVSTSRFRGVEDAFEITARVTSVENVNQWTKVGLMVRSHQGANAGHASLLVTPTTVKGVAFQRRRSDNATTVHTTGPAITAPIWLKLVWDGQLRAYYRQRTTDPWTFLAADDISFSGTTYEVGLVVSSHVDGTLARATFDNVSVRPVEFFGDGDIGAVGLRGTTQTDNVTTRLEGSGADIWGTADAFHYRFADVSRSGAISARVLTVENTNAWAKAGVMIREDTSAGSRHVALIVSAAKGIAMQYRAAPNGSSASIAIVPGAAPGWVRLARNGPAIIGEASDDGLIWREIGRIDLPMAEFVTAGLVVTSHDNSTLATAVFDDVVLRR